MLSQVLVFAAEADEAAEFCEKWRKGLLWAPISSALILRTPEQRTTNLQKLTNEARPAR